MTHTVAGDDERTEGRTDVGEAAVALTAELVSVNTVNPGLEPGAPGEARAVEMLRERLSGRGFATRVIQSAVPDRPSLLAIHRGSGGGRSLLLNGHLDTVAAGAMSEPFTPRVADDRMTGRGTSDMKAGVAALVVAAEEAARRGTGGDVVLALVADEENDSMGTEAVLRQLAASGEPLPEACLVGEPTALDLAAAHRGYAVVEVELRGRSAHSSCPQEGANAVTHLGRLLSAVEAADRVLQRQPRHSLTGSGSFMATVARGGEAPFSLAASASATIERRTVPGEDASAALREVRAILEELRQADPAVDARADLHLARQAWELRPDSAAAELGALLSDALAHHAGRRPESVGAPYWMESALWEEGGIPTLVCGPSGGGLHADHEWVDLGQVRAYARALAEVVVTFCGPGEEGGQA